MTRRIIYLLVIVLKLSYQLDYAHCTFYTSYSFSFYYGTNGYQYLNSENADQNSTDTGQSDQNSVQCDENPSQNSTQTNQSVGQNGQNSTQTNQSVGQNGQNSTQTNQSVGQNGENSTQTDQSVKSAMLQEHNKYRKEYGVPELTYDDQLAKRSEEWAKKMCDEKKMYHSHTPKVGENLWSGYATSPEVLPDWRTGVRSWMDEVKYYNWNNQPETMEEDTGHFTQCIWKSTKKVGCGKATSSDNLHTYLCCEYTPPGNVEGEYKENVLRPNRTT